MGKKIKVKTPATRVREDFIEFLEKSVPLYQKALMKLSWPVVQAMAKTSRDKVAASVQLGGSAFLIDKKQPTAPQLAEVAKDIAAMSFGGEGVTILGRHWVASHPEKVVANIERHVFTVDGVRVPPPTVFDVSPIGGLGLRDPFPGGPSASPEGLGRLPALELALRRWARESALGRMMRRVVAWVRSSRWR